MKRNQFVSAILVIAMLFSCFGLTACGHKHEDTETHANEVAETNVNVEFEALQAQVEAQGEQINNLINLLTATVESANQGEEQGAENTTTLAVSTTQVGEKSEATTLSASTSQGEEQKDYQASYEASQQIITVIEADMASLESKVEELENQIASGEQELQTALELIEAMKAKNEYEELLVASGYHVDEDGFVHFDYEWAVAQTVVKFDNGKYAHKFSSKADVVVLEDTRAIGVTGEYCDNYVDMARSGWLLAVYDIETKRVYDASLESLKYGKGIFLKSSGSGYELTPTEKVGAMGRQDEIAQWAIGTLPNKNNTFGVEFVFIADWYEPNPVNPPHCDDCDCKDAEECKRNGCTCDCCYTAPVVPSHCDDCDCKDAEECKRNGCTCDCCYTAPVVPSHCDDCDCKDAEECKRNNCTCDCCYNAPDYNDENDGFGDLVDEFKNWLEGDGGMGDNWTEGTLDGNGADTEGGETWTEGTVGGTTTGNGSQNPSYNGGNNGSDEVWDEITGGWQSGFVGNGSASTSTSEWPEFVENSAPAYTNGGNNVDWFFS